jgi:hypothetical protein
MDFLCAFHIPNTKNSVYMVPFDLGFPTRTLQAFVLSSMHATCPAHLIFMILSPSQYLVGYTVWQLVETLHYKPEGHGFDS